MVNVREPSSIVVVYVCLARELRIDGPRLYALPPSRNISASSLEVGPYAVFPNTRLQYDPKSM